MSNNWPKNFRSCQGGISGSAWGPAQDSLWQPVSCPVLGPGPLSIPLLWHCLEVQQIPCKSVHCVIHAETNWGAPGACLRWLSALEVHTGTILMPRYITVVWSKPLSASAMQTQYRSYICAYIYILHICIKRIFRMLEAPSLFFQSAYS